MDQTTRWRSDGAVVELRDLKYRFQTGADRQPVLDANGKRFPRDTDLVPALDEFHDLRGQDADRFARIETVSWFDPTAKGEGRFADGNLRPSGSRRIWNTNMDRACFQASLDRHNYR